MPFLRLFPILLALAIPALSLTVERSAQAKANPALLTWEFSHVPSQEPWDSLEITLEVSLDAEITSHILAWPQQGPWSKTRPKMETGPGWIKIKARTGECAGWDANASTPIVTLTLEVRSQEQIPFEGFEKKVGHRGFSGKGAVTSVRGVPAAKPSAKRLAGNLAVPLFLDRDALGRTPPGSAAALR